MGRLVLLALAAIAIGVGLAQSNFHPPVHFLRRGAATAAAPAAAAAEAPLPAGAKALGPAERFGEDTLSDKIDGKADLYLACGFHELRTQRFDAGDGAWFEVFQFEMKSPDAAFAAFSQQRRSGFPAVELGRAAYSAENALFAVQDRFYLELIASTTREDLPDTLVAAARKLLEPLPKAAAEKDPRALFPAAGLVADTVSYHPENGIGYAPFDRIYTAHYRLPAGEATTFLSARADEAEAARLAAGYRDFLRQSGAQAKGDALALFDVFERVDHRGKLLFGVHEAESLELANAAFENLAKGLAP